MVIEQKRGLLKILTESANSQEAWQAEQTLLKRINRVLKNRQNFFLNRQKATRGGESGSWYKSLLRN